MNEALQAPSRRPAVLSAVVGLYTLLCGGLAVLLLRPITSLVARVLGVPLPGAGLVLALPALPVGATLWWALVERRSAATYPSGAAFGALAAALTGAVWTAWFVVVWSVELLLVPDVLLVVGVVFAVVAALGAAAGLPPMFVRRRLGGETAE